MKVLKFGGTSLGSPERMQHVAGLVNNGDKQMVVLSAIAGATNNLESLADHLYAKEHKEANSLICKLETGYNTFIEGLYQSNEAKKQGGEMVASHFEYIRSFTQDMFTIYEERAILAQGELISTALFQFFLEETDIRSVLLPALDFMRINRDNEPDEWYIQDNLKKCLAQHPDEHLFITQGYICRNAYGEIDNLKRGGSDYTASLIGAAAGAEEIQIWTDIDGMHNNDPRVVENTRPIAELSFDEAAELAYFGARILHPSSIRPAKDKNIPVRLKNTLEPKAEGTLISSEALSEGVKAVAAKDGIIAVKIRSGRMLMAYGFLRSVFEVFERFKTSIDMITTSEVAVSLTIDDDANLEGIVKELEEFGTVETDHNLSIICVVGDFLADRSGYASLIFDALKDVPIRMVSYGGSKNNVSMLVNSEHKKDALVALNEGLFNM